MIQNIPTCSVNDFQKVSELYVPPIYLSHPDIRQKHLIPSDLLQTLEDHWNHSRIISPPLTIHLLKNVFVCSEGLVFTKDGSFVLETLTQHSREELQQAADQLAYDLACGVQKNHQPKGILCKKRGASNYGHWIAEMLPKAFFANRELNLNGIWPVIVHDSNKSMKNAVLQSLSFIGFKDDNVIFCNKNPTYFEELLIVDGLTQHSWFMSPLVFECMELIASQVESSNHKKIYVSRYPSITRNFENENIVKSIFLEHGYTEIVCAQIPFIEQVSLFKSAQKISGPMGAALTNTLFCKTNTDLSVFMPASAQEFFFWHIAEGKKLKYQEIRCQEIGPQIGELPWDKTIQIDLNKLHEFLSLDRE